MLRVARRGLAGEHPPAIFAPEAMARLERHLLRTLARTAELALFDELKAFRAAERGGYDAFVRSQLADGLVPLFCDYPVLARQVAVIIGRWVERDGGARLAHRHRSRGAGRDLRRRHRHRPGRRHRAGAVGRAPRRPPGRGADLRLRPPRRLQAAQPRPRRRLRPAAGLGRGAGAARRRHPGRRHARLRRPRAAGPRSRRLRVGRVRRAGSLHQPGRGPAPTSRSPAASSASRTCCAAAISTWRTSSRRAAARC